eukprot:GHVT01080112.1.p1 GENE.GHVT01080112.1~~GHVT01080112.1.p1  ORF type:complete len:321 (+),score=13.27 GHVT01080112.1:348-1310(+)
MTSRDFTALANSLPFYQDPTGGSRAAPQYSGRVPNSMPANLNMVSLEPTNPAVTGLGSRIGDGDTSSNSAASVLPNFLGNLMKGFEQARAATGAGNNRTILPGMRPDSPNISPGTVIDGAMNSGTIPEDSQGMLQKGLGYAKTGANVFVGGAQRVVNHAQSTFDDSPASLSTTRLIYFAIAVGVGLLFMTLAFFTLPLLLLAPAKFASFFTIGSICIMSSLGFLKGFQPFIAHLMTWERLPFTFTYVGSLFLTLYATMVVKSYILTLVFSIVQMTAVVSFLVSYVPGGKRALRFVASSGWAVVKRGCRCRDGGGSSSLPI